jgi:hypothetical protein
LKLVVSRTDGCKRWWLMLGLTCSSGNRDHRKQSRSPSSFPRSYTSRSALKLTIPKRSVTNLPIAFTCFSDSLVSYMLPVTRLHGADTHLNIPRLSSTQHRPYVITSTQTVYLGKLNISRYHNWNIVCLYSIHTTRARRASR